MGEINGNGKEANGLTSIGMLVAPLVAAMGGLALTGTIGRVQRDEPEGFCIALALVVISGILWVAAQHLPGSVIKLARKEVSLPTLTKVTAFLFGGVGFGLALVLAVNTADNAPRPQITPTLSDDASTLTTQVKASNLPTDRRLAFRIDLLRQRKAVGHVYESYIGPDGDGNVDQTITVSLPKADYTEIGIKAYTGSRSPKCDDFSEVTEDEEFRTGTGCAIITLPPAAVRQKP